MHVFQERARPEGVALTARVAAVGPPTPVLGPPARHPRPAPRVRRRSLHQALRDEGRVVPQGVSETQQLRAGRPISRQAVARRVARDGLVAVVGRGDDRQAAAVGREDEARAII